jgi:hypothetical protein
LYFSLQVTKVLKVYSKLIQHKSSSANARSGCDVLQSILTELTSAAYVDQLKPIVIPGENNAQLYQPWEKNRELLDSEKQFFSGATLGLFMDNTKRIHDHLADATNHLNWVYGNNIEDYNTRWAYTYRKEVGDRILNEENSSFHDVMTRVNNQIRNDDDNSTIVERAVMLLVQRSQKQIFLEYDFEKISQKTLIGYILIITNFVYDRDSCLIMKRLLRSDLTLPHVTFRQYFSAWTSCEFMCYKPFQSSTNWSIHDAEFIAECFIGPQAILTNKLLDLLITGKKMKRSQWKPIIGYIVGKEWLKILEITGSHVQSTEYTKSVFPTIHAKLLDELPEKPEEDSVQKKPPKFKSNLCIFAKLLGVLICEMGAFKCTNPYEKKYRGIRNAPNMIDTPLYFSMNVERNPQCPQGIVQHPKWTVFQIAQFVLFGKVFKLDRTFSGVIGEDKEMKLRVSVFIILDIFGVDPKNCVSPTYIRFFRFSDSMVNCGMR